MRLKIIAGNLVAVLALGLLSYALVRREVKGELSGLLTARVERDGVLFERSFRLSALEFLDQVRDRADQRLVRSALAATGEQARRERAFEVAENIAGWFRDPARGRSTAPDLVVITDETGRVLARDKDINRMFGHSLVGALPMMRHVLDTGSARDEVWFRAEEKKLLHMGMAPITGADGAVLGVLLVGYELSNGVAKAEAAALGHELAIFAGGSLYSTSLRGVSPEALESALRAVGTAGAVRGRPRPFAIEVMGAAFEGTGGTLPGSSDGTVTYALLAKRGDALAPAERTSVVLLLTLCAALGVVLYGFLVGATFLRPLERIEDGVLSVINGRRDHRIEVESAEFGGLAYRINQLLNVIAGVSDEPSEGRISRSSHPSEGTVGALRGGTAVAAGSTEPLPPIDDPSLGEKLAREPRPDYYRRLFREYLAAKGTLGEDASHLAEDRFVERVRGNERRLAEQHGCSEVRFQVQVHGDQVILRPVLVRGAALVET